VPQRLVPGKDELVDQLAPVRVPNVPVGDVVLEKVDICALVPLVAEKVAPVVVDDLGGRVLPRLELLVLFFVDVVQLLLARAQEVGRAQNVRRMVVELEVVVDDGVVDVIGAQEVLERPRAPRRVRLDAVDLDRGDVDGPRRFAGAAAGVDEQADQRDAGQERGRSVIMNHHKTREGIGFISNKYNLIHKSQV
jgi:hypothetical protein